MWLKYLFIIIFFYFLGILQNGFFAHFNIFGAVPNFILIFFFIFIFFSDSKKSVFSPYNLFLSTTAGLFLDLFSYDFFGASIISFLIISFLAKKSLLLLKEIQEQQPLIYFIPLFVLSFIFNDLFLGISYYFIEHIKLTFGLANIIAIIYNLAFAVAGFYIFKKIKLFSTPSRQLKLLP